MMTQETKNTGTQTDWSGRPAYGWVAHWYCPMDRGHDVSEAKRRFADATGEIREVGEPDMNRGHRIACVTSLRNSDGVVTLSFEPVLCPKCRATLRQVMIPEEMG